MKGYFADSETRFAGCINEMTLKEWHDHNNLVLDIDGHDTRTLEEILLGLDDIRNEGLNRFGEFDNIDIRVH